MVRCLEHIGRIPSPLVSGISHKKLNLFNTFGPQMNVFRKLTTFVKRILKPIAKRSPIPLSKGMLVDKLSERIIRSVCKPSSNCVDVGAHRGEILDIILDTAPKGQHFAFEPLPYLFDRLEQKYAPRVTLFNSALSDEAGTSTFHHVTSNPAYSGIKQREFDRPFEHVEEIEVKLQRLDDCIPVNTQIDFIKIDVEGAELLTLRGGLRVLTQSKPIILFEHGEKGAASYGHHARDMWQFLTPLGYKIYSLHAFLANDIPLTEDNLINHFENGDEFYFVAI